MTNDGPGLVDTILTFSIQRITFKILGLKPVKALKTFSW